MALFFFSLSLSLSLSLLGLGWWHKWRNSLQRKWNNNTPAFFCFHCRSQGCVPVMPMCFPWKGEKAVSVASSGYSLNPNKLSDIFLVLCFKGPVWSSTLQWCTFLGEASYWLYWTSEMSNLNSEILILCIRRMGYLQVCVYLRIHITKLRLQTTFPKPL